MCVILICNYDTVLSENVLKSLNIPPVRYKSALNQQVPLGGSAIFHTGKWMTTEMAKILAPLIVEFENKSAKERKKLTNELKIKKKEVTQYHIFNFICKNNTYIVLIKCVCIGKRKNC